VTRDRILNAADSDVLSQLVRAITADVFAEINACLDATNNSEEAVPYGDLAQAAMEAAMILDERERR